MNELFRLLIGPTAQAVKETATDTVTAQFDNWSEAFGVPAATAK